MGWRAIGARRSIAAATVVLGIEALAVAFWLLPASVHVVAWADDGPARVALLPPLSRLAWATAAACVLSTGVLVAFRRNAGSRLTETLAPCLVFWLWLVPYLPWLPDRWPLLLMLAGPLRWVVAVAAVVMASSSLPFSKLMTLAPLGRATVFSMSLVFYLGFGLISASVVGPAGDEPHYLVVTQSLLADGDLKIGDNHERGEYRAFYPGDLKPHFLRRGLDGEIYSIHAPGLPVMLLPAYAVAGYSGAAALMCLIAALTATVIFRLCEEAAGRHVAWAVWAAVGLTVPFVPHGWLLFPEMAATAVVALGILWLSTLPSGGAGRWAVYGIVFAALPWLHTKFIVLLAVLWAWAALRLWRSPHRLAALSTPVVLSLAAWLFYFYDIYGVLDPQAPYGSAVSEELSLTFIPQGVLGLLFDARFGLLWFAPAYVAALPGAWLLLRREETRTLALWVIALTLAFVLATTRFYMWWGGASAPARFLLPIVPALAVMLAAVLREWQHAAVRGLIGAGIAAGIAAAVIGSVHPEARYLFSEPTGQSPILQILQGPSSLAATPPAFTTNGSIRSTIELAPWVVAALLTGCAVWWFARPGGRSALRMGGAAVLVWLVAVAFVASPPMEARADAVIRGRQSLVHAYDGDALTAYDYVSRSPLVAKDVLATYPVTIDRAGLSVFLPQGSYDARVWFDSDAERDGEVAIVTARRIEVGRVRGPVTNPAIVPFNLPVTLGRPIVVVPDAQLAPAVRRVEFVPVSVAPRRQREAYTIGVVDPIGEDRGAFLAYLDDRAYPEGGRFWTRSTSRARVLVAPGSGSRIVLTVHLGPRSGEATITVAGEEHRIALTAGEPRTLEIPVAHGTRVVPLAIESDTEFRPATEDPGSTDRRSLGCFVEVEVR